MATKKYLDRLKKTYHQTQPSDRLLKFGWLELETQLEADRFEKPPVREAGPFRFLPVATAVLVVVFGSFFVLIQAAWAALPGEPLYPVKRLSETIVATVSPGSQIKVEHRASEILDISKKQNQGESLEKTVEEYQRAVLETRQETSFSSKQGQEFRQRLEQQEEEFKKVQTSSSSGPALKKAIEVAKEGRSGPGGGDDKDNQKQEDSSGKGSGEEDKVEDNSGSDSNSGPN